MHARVEMYVALYLRRSTDEIQQSDSIAAQEELLRGWATAHGHFVTAETFVDNASGRSADRPAFRRLSALVASGAAPFDAVLVRDITRWGRFQNIDESAFWEFYFLTHGVKVFYAQETFRDDDGPFAGIQKTLRRYVAAEFSREKGRLLQYGKYRTVSKGWWKGGRPPYGYARAIVTAHGTITRVLEHGERKALNTDHITLVPDERTAPVVRRIFRMFVVGEKSPFAIAKRLTAARIPTPRGTLQWTFAGVQTIVCNAAYAGIASARFEKSENFAAATTIATPGAWRGLVSEAMFAKAQRRVEDMAARRQPEAKDARLEAFFARHGKVSMRYGKGRRMQWVMPSGVAIGGGTPSDEAIPTAAIQTATAALERVFSVRREDGLVVLEGVLRVGFAVALPRGHAVSGVAWQFVFDGSEQQDMTVAVGLGADLRPAVYFIFVNMRWRRKARTFCPRLAPGGYATVLPRTWTEVVVSLRRNLFRYSTSAVDVFRSAIAALPVVNAYAVARSLGWPEESAWPLYARLRREGVALPPLAKQRGRRITIVCDDCGRQRVESPGTALQWKTGLCRACVGKRRAKYETCPTCGVRRALARKPVPVESPTRPGKRLKRCPTCAGRLSKPQSFSSRPRDARGRYTGMRKRKRC